jgi:hypothetical protein
MQKLYIIKKMEIKESAQKLIFCPKNISQKTLKKKKESKMLGIRLRKSNGVIGFLKKMQSRP